MSKEFEWKALVPLSVVAGICLLTAACVFVCNKLSIPPVNSLLHIPSILTFLIFIIDLILFLPMCILSFMRPGFVFDTGMIKNLESLGVFAYVRNPMYSGGCFSMISIGLLTRSTGIVTSGLILYVVLYIQGKREEQELLERFGCEYYEYRKITPAFIPNIGMMIKDLKNRRNHNVR
jgi:protein-S-isoprenylcysteine O-methyltransferase Ste14